MKRFRQAARGTLLALVAAAATGCAHTPPSTAASAAVPPRTMVITGSRIPLPVDPQTGYPTAALPPVRVYSSDDLATTGRTDVTGALQQLDPAIHR